MVDWNNYTKKYRERNQDKVRAWRKKYNENNREKRNERQRVYRAQVKALGAKIAKQTKMDLPKQDEATSGPT